MCAIGNECIGTTVDEDSMKWQRGRNPDICIRIFEDAKTRNLPGTPERMDMPIAIQKACMQMKPVGTDMHMAALLRQIPYTSIIKLPAKSQTEINILTAIRKSLPDGWDDPATVIGIDTTSWEEQRRKVAQKLDDQGATAILLPGRGPDTEATQPYGRLLKPVQVMQLAFAKEGR